MGLLSLLDRILSYFRKQAWVALLPLLLLGTGCTLRQIRNPVERECPSTDPTTFWECLSEIPRQDESESAFVSTLRAGSVVRKRSDQEFPGSCDGKVPEGFSRLDLELPGGSTPLHALFAPPREESGTIVIVVHGIFDSKFTKYILVTADLLRRRGFGVLAPDMRWHGCLLDKKWLPTLGIEEGKDLVEWARFLKREHTGSPVGLVGFSLGGLSVLHALGSAEGHDAFKAGGIAVCPASGLPFTMDGLDAPAFLSDRGLNGLFRAAFRHYLRQRLKTLEVEAEKSRLFAGFLDWLVQQPPFGSAWTTQRLLEEADPAPIAAKTRRPTLVLTTSNDPIISIVGSSELERAATGHPYLHVVRTPQGGHIGQIGLWPQWFADTLSTFFRYSPDVP